MQILLIHQYFKDRNIVGGARFNEMAHIWTKKGHKVTVIAGMVHGQTGLKDKKYKGKFVVKEKYSNNILVIRCHVSEAYNVSFFGRLLAYFSFVFSSIIGGVLKAKGKYDVILVSSPPLFVGITGYLLAKIKRIPFVFEVRDLWPESAIDVGILTNNLLIKVAYWFESFIYQKAILINVLTPAFKRILIENKGVDEKKIMMIPNASDFNLSDHLLESFDAKTFRKEKICVDENALLITYVGAHGKANHLIQIIDTAELIENEQVFFLLIGDGMEKQALIAEARKRNLNNVIFKASVPKEQIIKYILASDIGTSVLKKTDTFKTIYSNKTFDYMGCKKPI